MEKVESQNYGKSLTRVEEQGSKADLYTGFSLGFFMFSIYLTYAYAFLFGGIWVNQ
jgi:hypothetical protein